MNDVQVPARRISAAQRAVNAVWPFLAGRRGMLLLGLAAVGGGLVMNWDAVVALGLAPLLLGVLPCVAMCALGMCMGGAHEKCSSKQAGKGEADDA